MLLCISFEIQMESSHTLFLKTSENLLGLS